MVCVSRNFRVEVDGKQLLLATDLEIEAELITLIYRYRWQIELFFKWLKSILGCRHLMAESPQGVAIQIYSALIAALMLQAFTGKRPGKRAMELIRMYLMGYADLNELIALLGVEKTTKCDHTGNFGHRRSRALSCRDACKLTQAAGPCGSKRVQPAQTAANPHSRTLKASIMPNSSGPAASKKLDSLCLS
jgi:hypothetical protein